MLSLEAVGQADLAAKTPMTADNLFWIASMTKPMTALAVMMLVFLTSAPARSAQTSAIECPPGTTPAGKGPPDGDAVWCERIEPGGKHVKHGPYHAWTVTGVRQEDGRYENGHKEGTWTTYWDNGASSRKAPRRYGITVVLVRHRRVRGA
jgi:hypothetical protein